MTIETPSGDDAGQTRDLVIVADVRSLPILTEAVDHLAVENGIPPTPVRQVQVALDEIVSNVIKYAWPDGAAHELTAHIAVSPSRIRIEIVDDGIMFDPVRAPDPASGVPGERRRPGGVGIHLARQLVDEISYERSNGCNHTTLTKHVHKTASR